MASPELEHEPLQDKVRHYAQGSLLEGLYEAGAKMRNCSAFMDEFMKIPPTDTKAAFLYMLDLNRTRHAEDYDVPEIQGNTISFPDSFKWCSK